MKPDEASNSDASRRTPESIAGELLEQLAELHATMKQLAELAGRKLTAIRAADSEALHQCAECESQLLNRLFRSEPKRKALLASLAQSLRCPSRPSPRLSEIADRLSEPLASALRARSLALAQISKDLQKKNRLVGTVARNLQSHLRGVFAALTGASTEAVVYGPAGQPEVGQVRFWMDAVG